MSLRLRKYSSNWLNVIWSNGNAIAVVLIDICAHNKDFIPSFHSIGLENPGQNCWFHCNFTQGKCSWCGSDGYCCRKNWTCGNGCDGSFGGDGIHACVLKPTGKLILKRNLHIYIYCKHQWNEVNCHNMIWLRGNSSKPNVT